MSSRRQQFDARLKGAVPSEKMDRVISEVHRLQDALDDVIAAEREGGTDGEGRVRAAAIAAVERSTLMSSSRKKWWSTFLTGCFLIGGGAAISKFFSVEAGAPLLGLGAWLLGLLREQPAFARRANREAAVAAAAEDVTLRPIAQVPDEPK